MDERHFSRLGAALLHEGFIDEKQLQYALQIQQDSLSRKRLGEILVDLGAITKRQLREVARKYKHRIPLGSVLTDSGYISDNDLAGALEEQRLAYRPLGQILIERKSINEEQFAIALARQLSFPYIVPSQRMVDRRLVARFSKNLLRQYGALPLFQNQDIVTVLVANPLDHALEQMLRSLLGSRYELAVGPKSAIEATLRQVIEESELIGARPPAAFSSAANPYAFGRYALDAPKTSADPSSQIVAIVDHILAKALAERASDIHLESLESRLRIRHRIDGKLLFETDLPKHLSDGVIRRLKVLANIDVGDAGGDDADGHMYLRANGDDIDLRVSFYPTVFGSSVAIRVLTNEIGLKDLSDLGMLPRALETLKMILDAPSGMILFAGPTGSGKTTSLYASLNYLNKNDLKICTVESPVEYRIEGIAQSQLKRSEAAMMPQRIKAMMHQDPDVIVLGEINDEDSASAAVEAALSGHKVFSTIHTDDSIGAILRIMDMRMRTYLLSSTGLAVISQRLLRTICRSCKEPFSPPRRLLREFKIVDFDPARWTFRRGKGCAACHQTGFLGRTGAFEILAVNDEIRDACLSNQTALLIRRIAQDSVNYISLREAALIKALLGETTLEEAFSLLSYSEKQAFASMSLAESKILHWIERDAEMDMAEPGGAPKA